MANECGIIVVELEAKENVMGPLLATANEAIDSTKSLSLDEMEISTRYILLKKLKKLILTLVLSSRI